MKVEQIYTGCLAQGAYYIESNGEAVVIDSLREVQPYIDKAERNNAKIKYVFETHFHADFVSGHLDLSKKTGAPIVYGPNAKPEFEAHIAKDGEVFKVGNVTLTALHTPGHTMESTCYLLRDEQGKESAIFSGDTLFIGAKYGFPRFELLEHSLFFDQGNESRFKLRKKFFPVHVVKLGFQDLLHAHASTAFHKQVSIFQMLFFQPFCSLVGLVKSCIGMCCF